METLVLDFVKNIIEKNAMLVYAVFFLSCFLQMVFPPHPGDVILIFQGYVTGISDTFDYFTILLNAVAATFAGSLCIYKLGYAKGDRVFQYAFVKRFITQKTREKTHKVFEKFGVFTILASKFIPGVNAMIILSAGIFKVKRRIAYTSILGSILVHHVVLLLLGRFLGYNMGQVKKIITTYNSIVVALLILAAVIYTLYKVLNKKKQITGT